MCSAEEGYAIFLVCHRHMLMQAAVNPTPKSSGSWDSIHVFDAQDRARTSHYKLTSTVILSLGTDSETLGGLDLLSLIHI